MAPNTWRGSTKYERQYGDHKAYDLHAETHCILKAQNLLGDLNGMDLYVIRYLKTGEVRCAKPCAYCVKAIKAAKLRRVYYTDDEGQWHYFTVSKLKENQ